MAEIFEFYVNDNRTITFKLTEPIMLEDNGVSDWRFHIPNVVNGLDATGWQWWLVYVNAKNEKYTIPLTLEYDYDRPDAYSIATYTVDYGMSCKVGNVRFSLEAIDADTGGTILHEWHTKTYSTNVVDTLQGNQVEYAETESDIISALLIEVRNRTNQLIGGATPTPVSAVSEMLDTDKLYLLTTDGEWYYYNGSAWVSGGVYGAGIVDPTPTQGSTNAVSSGGVYTEITGLREDLESSLAPAIVVDSDSDYQHTLDGGSFVHTITFSNDSDAFGYYSYADLLSLDYTKDATYTVDGVTFTGSNKYITLNGTCGGNSKGKYWGVKAVSGLTGNYKLYAITSTEIPMYIRVVVTYSDSSSAYKTLQLSGATSGATSTSITFTDAIRFEIYTNTNTGTDTYTDAKIWFGIFPEDVTITTTEIAIGSDYELTIDADMSYVDSMMCPSVVNYNADTKRYIEGYVENNVPEGVLTTSELPFVTPEMYGAVGDGNTDDTVALQNCINAASTSLNNNIPLRGYGKYKTTSSLRIGGYYLDIFIKSIDYRGTDTAIIISGKNSKFEFNEILAANSGACGIRVQSSLDDTVKFKGFDSNVLTVYQRIYADGNALEMIRTSDATEGLMYNVINIHKMTSVNANCIYASATDNFSENDIYGQYFNAPNGYAYYGATPNTHNTKLYGFCIEQFVKNGVYGGAYLYGCRTVECMNHYTQDELDRGKIFVFDNVLPRSYADKDTDIGLLHIDADNAKTWEDVIEDTRDYYDANDVRPITAFRKKWGPTRWYSVFENCWLTAESGFAGSTALLPKGKAFVYYNHIAFKPDCEWEETINDATYTISLQRTRESAQNYITPTIFDINTSNTSIYLDWSYCCIAINEFIVKQYSDKKAIVYDKFGNLLFDGTSQPEGIYTFKCIKTNVDEQIAMRDGELIEWTDYSYWARNIYTGSNEKWLISKSTII